MSYNATYGNGNNEIDMNSFFSFKKHNDLFVKNYIDLTFDDIYRYYLVLMWFGVTCGITAYAFKQLYLLCVMIWNRMGDEDDGDNDNDAAVKVPETAFENRYFTEYDDLEEKDLTDKFVKDLTLNVIREETPKGEVLMYYGHEMESFIYYSKTKEIPYKYLETLARKYVIMYDCKKLYVDIRKEYEKGLNKYKEMKENKTPESGTGGTGGEVKGAGGGEKKKKQLFVSFKTYNRKGEVNIKQKDKIYILREKANRYSYRGKIEEYKEEEEEQNEKMDQHSECMESNGVVKEKKIDFSSFKKMNRP
jgi:tetratricopeptide (TPR) repeat protein